VTKSIDIHRYTQRNRAPRDSDPHPSEVVPFGLYGAGIFTAHPVGLVVALGLIFMGLAVLPEVRLFFLCALPVGAVFGFFLWIRHR